MSAGAETISRWREVPFRIWPWGLSVAALGNWVADVAYGMVGFARGRDWLGRPFDLIVGGLELMALVGCGSLLWRRARVLLPCMVLLFGVIGAESARF